MTFMFGFFAGILVTAVIIVSAIAVIGTIAHQEEKELMDNFDKNRAKMFDNNEEDD